MNVRIGGSFVYPPERISREKKSIKSVTFIAGGVGINPLFAMLEDICHNASQRISVSSSPQRLNINILYSSKVPPEFPEKQDILFFKEIATLLGRAPEHLLDIRFTFFATGMADSAALPSLYKLEKILIDLANPTSSVYTLRLGRIGTADLRACVEAGGTEGEEEGEGESLFYVCGPLQMTDGIVEELKGMEGVKAENVMCEKWW